MSLFNPQPGAGNPLGLANPLFSLEYPQSIGVFTSYADAQKAVDALADQNFPVNNIAIVGTDLKLVERVTGRKTWGTVIQQGMLSGLSTALMIAMILFLFDPTRDFFGLFLEALAIGMVIGVGFAALGHRMSGGQRDFTSVSQTIPGKFEILCEHKVANQARDLLSRTPQGRQAAFDPARYGQPPAPYPYPGYQPQGPGNVAPSPQPPAPMPSYPQPPAPVGPEYAQGQPTPGRAALPPRPQTNRLGRAKGSRTRRRACRRCRTRRRRAGRAGPIRRLR